MMATAGAAVIIVLVRRRSRIRNWQERAVTTGRSVASLNDEYLTSLLALATSQQLQQTWQVGSGRFDELAAELSTLQADAPDQQGGMATTAVRDALTSLRQSVVHVVDLAVMGAPADTQLQAATAVQNARTVLTRALSGFPPQR